MDHERDGTRDHGPWELRPKTLVIIRSADMSWRGMESILRDWPNITVLATLTDPNEAVQAVRQLKPSAALTAVEVAGMSVVDLVRQLHDVSPETRVMVFTHELDHTLRLLIEAANVYGYVLWNAVTPEVIYWYFGAALEAGLRVASSAVVEKLAKSVDHR